MSSRCVVFDTNGSLHGDIELYEDGDFVINGNEINLLNHAELINFYGIHGHSKHNSALPYTNLIYKGQSIKITDQYKGDYFASVLDLDSTNSVITLNKQLTDYVTKITLYPLSGIYTESIVNNNSLGVLILLQILILSIPVFLVNIIYETRCANKIVTNIFVLILLLILGHF